jgi:hypothetical protein
MKLLLAAALISLATAAPADDSSDHWDARVTAVSGKVVVHPADGSADSDAKAGMPLEEGDRVTTLAGASADLSLDGGSLISLSENSDFKLEKTAKDESVFSLAFGSLLAKIQNLGSRSLSVRTNTSVAAVRGTEFGVDAADGQSSIGVFDEGRVEVSGGTGKVILTANHETSVELGHAPRKASKLKRFADRRTRMRDAISRLAEVKAHWKAMTPSERRSTRVRAFKKKQADGDRRSRNREERQERRTK